MLRFTLLEDRLAPAAGFVLSDNALIPFETDFPTLPRAAIPVTGLGAAEQLVGIDFRPSNNHLYGLTTGASGGVRLYDLDFVTGKATAVSAAGVFPDVRIGRPIPPGLPENGWGFDFDPALDQARVTDRTGTTFRLDPAAGTVIDADLSNRFLDPDGYLPISTAAIETAYTNNAAGATATTQYTLGQGVLFAHTGSPTSLPASPLTVTLNGSPLSFTGSGGFDVPPGTSAQGLAAVAVGSKYGLYAVTLADGKAASLGLVGDGSKPVQGLAVATGANVPRHVDLLAVGSGQGLAATVRVYNPDGGLRFSLTPYESTFTGGVLVATGDVTGDGVDDVITGTGVGGGPRVRVFDGVTAQPVREFFPYEETFRGGVLVAAADTDGDGFADVITGTGVGGGPRVQVFDGKTGVVVDNFFAYESTFRGGVQVAGGDTDGDGKAEVVTGTGVGGGPRVQVFRTAQVRAAAITPPVPLQNYFAYEGTFRGGVFVGAGDVNGDGRADVLAGTGPGGGPRVRAFDGVTGAAAADYFAFDQSFRGGVPVAGVDRTGTGGAVIVAGTGAGIGNRVVATAPGMTTAFDLVPFDAPYAGGVFVG